MYQKFIAIGRLGGDPEWKETRGGGLATFSIATSETWKDKNGERQERTEWHNCVAFGRTGEVAADYLLKGHLVQIEGKVRQESWEDRDTGAKRYATKIYVDRVTLFPKSVNESVSSGGGRRARTDNQGYDGPPEDDDIPF